MQNSDIENAGPANNHRQESMKQRMRSVYFAKEDTAQDIPSLPVLDLVSELENKHGKSLYAAEFIKAVEDADSNGDGLISIPELIQIIESMNNLKKENSGLKQYLGVALGSLLLVLMAIFGLVFAVVDLTQKVSTGGSSGNALISKTTGIIVDVHPSNGGGIFLDMGAFTEPLNITFPGLRTTEECVGQVAASAINEHYSQFTTGGSAMTIRNVDYSRAGQPVVYTHIPASNIDVTYQTEDDTAAGIAAAEATMAIKNTMGAFEGDPETRRRLVSRVLNDNIMAGAKTVDNTQNDDEERARSGVVQTSTTIVAGKGNTVSSGRGRRLAEEEFGMVTVDDYMKSFAAQYNAISFTKDNELTDEYYFVCLASGPTATN